MYVFNVSVKKCGGVNECRDEKNASVFVLCVCCVPERIEGGGEDIRKKQGGELARTLKGQNKTQRGYDMAMNIYKCL